ncbi:response regulator [Calothrix sp. NIES-3974]|uniref:response regulator n=1 Tax=Calothrix sp. NIES-3974 TaxID=2005462 RepID=UPI000B5EA804|nr:response regulator transcription factor [Calothrix sp. NIES-3974]BAZ05162.1 LuxR family two component transcriptional regulator [Calothrix sp. NIES-3974]
MKTEPIKILLVEDDELFRLGLSVRLMQEPSLQIIAEAEDGETAIEFAAHNTLDVVLLDIGLPGIGGVETCRQIKQIQPNLSVLILTSYPQQSLISKLIEAKANGYCVKGIPPENLILAIRSVAAGASWWDAIATEHIQAIFQSSPIPTSPTPTSSNHLTKREQEILKLIAKGKSNQEIAEILYISPGTVRVHVHTILQKLEVRDRTQAALIAIQQGLLSP